MAEHASHRFSLLYGFNTYFKVNSTSKKLLLRFERYIYVVESIKTHAIRQPLSEGRPFYGSH